MRGGMRTEEWIALNNAMVFSKQCSDTDDDHLFACDLACMMLYAEKLQRTRKDLINAQQQLMQQQQKLCEAENELLITHEQMSTLR